MAGATGLPGDLDQYISKKPAPRVRMYHSVGASDALTASEVKKPVGDGRDLPYVLGDLDAEFQLRGGPVLWYWRQALHSAWALATMGLRRSEWECALLAIFLASATPILFMDAWWRYLLCHVPLKADLARGGE